MYSLGRGLLTMPDYVMFACVITMFFAFLSAVLNTLLFITIVSSRPGITGIRSKFSSKDWQSLKLVYTQSLQSAPFVFLLFAQRKFCTSTFNHHTFDNKSFYITKFHSFSELKKTPKVYSFFVHNRKKRL